VQLQGEIIYSVGKKFRIQFPPDRDLVVRFVSSCARNAQVTSILVRDINEMVMLVNWLAKNKYQSNWIRT
jgi:hypothetical protein